MPDLSIVIPFHDEAPCLADLHAELVRVLDGLDLDAELIFVDDGSTDAGPDLVRELVGRDARVRLVELTPQSGQSAALEAGFRAARGAVVATLDADGQNDPADLPALLDGLATADCVCGVRRPRRDPPGKRIASRVANAVRRRVLGDPFEVSRLRREDYDFIRPRSKADDVLSCNNAASSATARGHQFPAQRIIEELQGMKRQLAGQLAALLEEPA